MSGRSAVGGGATAGGYTNHNSVLVDVSGRIGYKQNPYQKTALKVNYPSSYHYGNAPAAALTAGGTHPSSAVHAALRPYGQQQTSSPTNRRG
ncbi:hypothetical protein QQS21_006496 [Conoideocrella luteorostrata]|uniref:Uncharacterized protein n=1 Tax=Conoideocrella luteorostrata TaxID=1105319 RepID=A0AAJ0CQG2_9HYPO|nr:hypothetical protein QQS21_006496 [Conoideocrella luteorostrata]